MLFYAAVILGAAFFAPDSGTEARAMGGTGVAFSDNPIAVWYNPAALADQHGIGILADGNVLFLNETFTRAGTNPDTGNPYTEVKGNPPAQIVPALLGTYSLLNNKLTIATGIVGPTGPRQRFPVDGDQRFALTEQWLVQLNYGLWAGYRINSWVAVGAGFEGQFNTIEQSLVASTATANDQPTEDPQFDLLANLEAQSVFTPSGILGVQITPPRLRGWSFGASYRLGSNVVASGTLDTPSGPISEAEIEMKFATPSMIRIGAGLQRRGWQAELDLVVEDWSAHDEVLIDIDDENPLVAAGLLPTEIELPHNYGVAYSVRLGGAKDLGAKLRLMAGYYFETSAVPSRFMGVDSIDNFKHGANVGVGYTLGPVRISGAYTFVYITPRDVNDSEVEALAIFAPDDSFIINNGSYKGTYNMFSLSVLTRF